MSVHEPFFTFSRRDDEVMIQYAVLDPLRKKAMGIRLNYKEAGTVICWHIIEEAHKGRTIRQIIDSSRKLLNASDVMIGVPEIMERIVVNVRFKDGNIRQVAVENPVKPRMESACLGCSPY